MLPSMVDVPRSDQEWHLRAVIPEWLTRPPEHEVLRRERAAHDAREAARVEAVEQRAVRDTLRAAVLFALAVQLVLTGFAVIPLLQATGLGVLFGLALYRLDEAVWLWIVGGVALSWIASLGTALNVALIVGVCVSGICATVVGILRDPSFRI